ncbi:MAG: redoxin domain-containing protein, partial [Gemmataceae bacterium]|nr:redoxin domain-containing protein [Gemmataceae bacterium]
WAKEAETPRQETPNLAIPGGGPANRPMGTSTTDYNGVLAGSLVDAYNRPVPRAYLQIAAADGSMRPIEMTVERGYFTVPGLTPGRSYLLTARVFDGERKLAGRVQVTPPNPRVVIRLSEDLYSGTIPPPPSLDEIGMGTSGPRPVRADATDDGWKPPESPAATVSPTTTDPPPPPLPASPPADERIPAFNAENITGRQETSSDPTNPPPPPLINLPPPQRKTSPDVDPPPGESTRDPSGPNRTSAVRSPNTPLCEFSGPHRLKNMALRDAYGTTWEFQQAQGQLILLDFWGTWCRPCLAAIPHIKRLHTEYGPRGLEVVSIACERGPESQRTRQVLDAIDRHKVNYRVLVAEEYDDCPVQRGFGIQSYPTLILIDRQGNIRWRGDSSTLPQLESVLRRELLGGR